VDDKALLRVRCVKKKFPIPSDLKRTITGRKKWFWAVNDVSINIGKGESFGLVGESGCGKTTLAKIILGLLNIDSGSVEFGERRKNIFEYSGREMRDYRRKVQMIFQNPDTSLNPQMKVGESIKEAIKLNPNSKSVKSGEIKECVKEYMRMVGLDVKRINNLLDDLSGGEKRRIGIIRALVIEPSLIVADEPFAGLDFSIRDKLIECLMEKQTKDGLAFLFISHDIDIVGHLSNRIGVMYLGKIVEMGDSKEITSEGARHPYTQSLLAASQYLKERGKRENFDWRLPSASLFSKGCPFRQRCYLYKERIGAKGRKRCDEEEPKLQEIDGRRSIACHFWEHK
jgi:oligopeptide/dipeptide ABC transporter ATP-binding protein